MRLMLLVDLAVVRVEVVGRVVGQVVVELELAQQGFLVDRGCRERFGGLGAVAGIIDGDDFVEVLLAADGGVVDEGGLGVAASDGVVGWLTDFVCGLFGSQDGVGECVVVSGCRPCEFDARRTLLGREFRGGCGSLDVGFRVDGLESPEVSLQGGGSCGGGGGFLECHIGARGGAGAIEVFVGEAADDVVVAVLGILQVPLFDCTMFGIPADDACACIEVVVEHVEVCLAGGGVVVVDEPVGDVACGVAWIDIPLLAGA